MVTVYSFFATIALTHSKAAGEFARILSTRPNRNLLVEALSYVDTSCP